MKFIPKPRFNTAHFASILAQASPGTEGATAPQAWLDLRPEQRQAAALLGYTAQAWDSDETPAASNRRWDELGDSQHDAARLALFCVLKRTCLVLNPRRLVLLPDVDALLLFEVLSRLGLA